MERGTPPSRPQIAQGKVRLQVDNEWFDEGVHFAIDRVNGKIFILRQCALGQPNQVLSLDQPIDFTRPVVKKKRKKAQWKIR